ncbi:non-reducing end alpha-L-arabinofuranosidase family hydrolase [Streptomyces europaeiscabiei]|nr:non-reducing end alpha-L-arabinofuranosidase family hydrolase [Streptomyces europaeiscabiei]
MSNTSGRRYFRSFTSTCLTGNWTPHAATEYEPFASRNNVTFPGGVRTEDISHGQMVRSGNDQTVTIDPCRMQYAYQGIDPIANEEYRHGLRRSPTGTSHCPAATAHRSYARTAPYG